MVWCFGCGGVKVANTNRLSKLVRKVGSVLGVELTVGEVAERRILKKLLSIRNNTAHPLHQTLLSYQSSFSKR
ncbi:hypothetical protein WMY93_031748, partial [Mugilogobius chulae]